MPTAWIYSRVSTQRQVPGLSLDAQEERALARAQADGHSDTQVIRDAGVSGRSMDRPGIAQLLATIGPGDTLYVWSISRIGRNVREVLRVVEDIIIPQQITLVSVTEPIDTSTAVGRCMLSILASLAQLQREEIAGDSRRGMEARVARGHHWSTPPIGYRCEDKRLVVDDETAPAVRDLFRRAAAGATLGELVRMLNAQGPAPPRGAAWYVTSLRLVLTNPTYVGRMTFRGQTLDAVHEPLVDERTWQAVQRSLATRARVRPPARSQSWSALYRCGVCGRSVRRKGETDPAMVGYICAHRQLQPASARHESIWTIARKADHWLWEGFCRTITGEALREWEVLQGASARDTAREAERGELVGERDRLTLALDRNHRGWVGGLVPEGTYADLNRELMDSLRGVERRLTELATLDDLVGAAQLLVGGREMLETLDDRQRRDVLLRLVDHVALTRNELVVHWMLPTLPRMHIILPRRWSPARPNAAQITYLEVSHQRQSTVVE